MDDRRPLLLFLLRRRAAEGVRAADLPAMLRVVFGDAVLHRLRQRLVGGIHVGEHGVAALRRHRHRVQDGRHRRLGAERLVGMPHRRPDGAARLALVVEVGDDVQQREVVLAAVELGVALEGAELLGEGDLLRLGELLVPEHEKLVTEKGLMHRLPGRRIERPGQVEADHLRRHQLRQGQNLETRLALRRCGSGGKAHAHPSHPPLRPVRAARRSDSIVD